MKRNHPLLRIPISINTSSILFFVPRSPATPKVFYGNLSKNVVQFCSTQPLTHDKNLNATVITFNIIMFMFFIHLYLLGK